MLIIMLMRICRMIICTHFCVQVKRPLTAIVGGAKISDKILVIENLIDQSDRIMCIGGMAYTFLKAHLMMMMMMIIKISAWRTPSSRRIV